MASPAIISSIFQELQAFNQTRCSDLQPLGSALQSGNLDAAKQAFNDLASAGKVGPFRNAEPFSNSNRAQPFEAIGQALQAGELAGAQAVFSALQSTLANHRSVASAQQSTPAVIVNIGGGENGREMLPQLKPFTRNSKPSARRANPTSPSSARPCNPETLRARNRPTTR